MPRTRSLSWAELRIGLVTIAGFVITAIAIFLLTGDRGFFWQRYQLKTMFDNVAGLRPGSPVRVAGYDVGTVTQMAFAGEQVEVTFEVHESMGRQITTALAQEKDRLTASLAEHEKNLAGEKNALARRKAEVDARLKKRNELRESAEQLGTKLPAHRGESS